VIIRVISDKNLIIKLRLLKPLMKSILYLLFFVLSIINYSCSEKKQVNQ